MPGATISAIEVTNISKHGLWLLTPEGEHFLPFEDYPWFRDAPVAHILNVEEPVPGHYHWPDLDVDLCLAITAHAGAPADCRKPRSTAECTSRKEQAGVALGS